MSKARRAPDVTLRSALASDLSAVRALLEASLLPVADLTAEHMGEFLLAEDGSLLGAVGLEGSGNARLLRSLAVAERAQGQRLGHRLLQAGELRAAAQGAAAIFLLTTTAEPFFARAGYQRVAREEAPAGLRLLAEFSKVCPSTAACMRKQLA